MEEDHFIEFSYNPNEGFVRIPIYDRYGWKVAETIIDLENLEKVRHYRWYLHVNLNGKSYVRTWSGNQHRNIDMSHIILDLPQGRNSQVDHVDGDELNNLRLNLRACTHAENSRNRPAVGGTSKFKGVCWQKGIKRWRARIEVDYEQIHLGCFGNEEDAAKAYNEAAKKYFGEFAYLNEVKK